MSLGIRAHDIDKNNLEELVNEIENRGLTSVQLALNKSFDFIPETPGVLTPGLAFHIGSAFRRHYIQVSVLGCYINMIHPDPVIRRKSLERFKENIRFARDFGCSIIATETGNVHAEITYTEENFKEKPFFEVVDSVKELVEEAEKFGVIVGIEAGINHPIYSPKVMKRLLDSVSSNNLQVIFDPVNLLTVETYTHQDEIIQEAFDLFGDRIVVVHAKDFIVEDQILKTVPVGQGLLNYHLVMKYLKTRKPFINVLIESTREPYINGSISFLKRKYQGA